MLNQNMNSLSDPPSSSFASTKERNQNQNQNQNNSQMYEVQSFSPHTLTDTFSTLTYTIENGNTVMQGCTNVAYNLSEKIVSEKIQFLGNRKDKVTVELKCAFLEILKINTKRQMFVAEVLVQAKWQEPALQTAAKLNDKSLYDPRVHWIPRLTILNAEGPFAFNRRTFTVDFKQKGYKYPVVTLHWRFKGLFRENLELEHFPFDVQDLTIHLSTERSVEEVDLIEDEHALCSVNNKTFPNSGEWRIYEHVDTYRDHTTQEYVSSTTHPILFAQCRVRRKFGFYLWDIAFVVALISSFTFFNATLEPDKVDRLYNNGTLLMTAFILRITIENSLPRISYNTYLDVYVLITLLFLGVQIALSSFMAILSKNISIEEVYYWDFVIVSTIAVMFVSFHILFLLYISNTAYRRRRLMEQKDKLYQAKKLHLETYGVMLKSNQAD